MAEHEILIINTLSIPHEQSLYWSPFTKVIVYLEMRVQIGLTNDIQLEDCIRVGKG